MGGTLGPSRSATSIVACSLALACSFRLRTPPRFIRHRRRFGSVPPKTLRQGILSPGPQRAMGRALETKLFARVTVISPGEFLGIQKAKETLRKKQAFS